MWSLVRRIWNDMVSMEGGYALLWMDGLLVLPLAMAALFFPRQVAEWVGALALVSFGAYEGLVLWRKKHPRGTHA